MVPNHQPDYIINIYQSYWNHEFYNGAMYHPILHTIHDPILNLDPYRPIPDTLHRPCTSHRTVYVLSAPYTDALQRKEHEISSVRPVRPVGLGQKSPSFLVPLRHGARRWGENPHFTLVSENMNHNSRDFSRCLVIKPSNDWDIGYPKKWPICKLETRTGPQLWQYTKLTDYRLFRDVQP